MGTRVPKCTITSKNRSGSFRPNRFFIITRCPELLMGKNSVIPCKIPKIIASMGVIRHLA